MAEKKITNKELKELAQREMLKLRSMIRSNRDLALALEAAEQKRGRAKSRPPKAQKLSA